MAEDENDLPPPEDIIETDEETDNSESDDAAILSQAKKRYELSSESESENRRAAIDDQNFLVGDQWEADVKRDRDIDRRPSFTINRLGQFVNQIANDQRQNPLSGRVSPVSEGASIETAKIIQGLVRHIEYDSNADIAYQRAFTHVVECGGPGWWRILTEYCDDHSFDQNVKVVAIRNQFSVFSDPNSHDPAGADQEFCQIVDDLTKDEYKATYPDSKLSTMSDWGTLGNEAPDWIEKHTVRVAEYYYKVYTQDTLVKIEGPEGKSYSTLQSKLKGELLDGFKIVAKRPTVITQIKWVKHNGYEILDRKDIPGKFIPMIKVIGKETWLQGKQKLSGVIRDAKDSQKMYNYLRSAAIEVIALAPKAPWIGAEGQFEDHEAEWKTANIRNHSKLEYKPTTIAGQPVPPPQRNTFEPPIQALSQALNQSIEELKSTTGIYDSTLGNMGQQEQSGIAILRRNTQSQISNYHFIDNLKKSIRHSMRVMLGYIKVAYDAERVIRVMHPDDSIELVQIGKMFKGKDGQDQTHNLDVGEYDIVMGDGPSYQTKRQEASATMLELVGKVPQTMSACLDILVREMDAPWSQELSDRLKKMLPPQLQDNDTSQVPPQVKNQMAQMGQMIQSLSQQLHAATDELETRKASLESNERIAFAKMDVDVRKKAADLNHASAMEILRQEIAQINSRMSLLNTNQPIDNGINPGVSGQPQGTPGNVNQPPSVGQPIPAQQQSTGGMPPG